MHGITVIFALQEQVNTTFKNAEFRVSLWKSQTTSYSSVRVEKTPLLLLTFVSAGSALQRSIR